MKILRASCIVSRIELIQSRYLIMSYKKIKPLSKPLLRVNAAEAKRIPDPSL
jgi:hypothetical protein